PTEAKEASQEMHRVVAEKRQEWQRHPPPRPVSRHRKFQNRQHHRKEAKHPEPHGLNRIFWFAAHAASAHSTSASRPAAPDTASFPVLHGLLESAKGIAVRC